MAESRKNVFKPANRRRHFYHAEDGIDPTIEWLLEEVSEPYRMLH
jgi:hypothetical protein